MQVRDHLAEASKRLVTVTADLNVREAAAHLADPGIDLLTVVDDDGVMAGIVTDSDIVKWVASRQSPLDTLDVTVGDLMTKVVFSCRPDQSLASVVGRAADRGLKHFPIVDEGNKPIGVVYIQRALLALDKENQLSAQHLLDYIGGAGNRW